MIKKTPNSLWFKIDWSYTKTGKVTSVDFIYLRAIQNILNQNYLKNLTKT